MPCTRWWLPLNEVVYTRGDRGTIVSPREEDRWWYRIIIYVGAGECMHVCVCVCLFPKSLFFIILLLFITHSLLRLYRWLQSCLLVCTADTTVALLPVDDRRIMRWTMCDACMWIHTRVMLSHMLVQITHLMLYFDYLDGYWPHRSPGGSVRLSDWRGWFGTSGQRGTETDNYPLVDNVKQKHMNLYTPPPTLNIIREENSWESQLCTNWRNTLQINK